MTAMNRMPSGYKVNGCEATREGALGYKQTEVGVIPEDWEVPKVDAIARVVDSLHQTPSFSADGYVSQHHYWSAMKRYGWRLFPSCRG